MKYCFYNQKLKVSEDKLTKNNIFYVTNLPFKFVGKLGKLFYRSIGKTNWYELNPENKGESAKSDKNILA